MKTDNGSETVADFIMACKPGRIAAVMFRWSHLLFGLVLFIVFTQTGAYMRADFPDKEAIPQELRLLMRSRHIYILFSALIHLALGVYLQIRPARWQRILQSSGSVVLFASSVLLVWAFITETYALQHFSDISRFGIYTSLAGMGLHLLGGMKRRHPAGVSE